MECKVSELVKIGHERAGELVKIGHERAADLRAACGTIAVAQLISDLATQLDCTALALREMTKKRDAEHADVLAWEKTMFKTCGEDGLKSVAEKFAELQARCAALAAENAGLKEACGGDGSYRDCPACAHSEYIEAPETPYTDAFLAEVRAQVWIEGNEPAEFGRYWVRYETDIGPQYCSAKWIEHNFCASSDTNIHKIWLADHSRSISSLKGVTHYTRLPEPIEGGAK